MSKYILTRKELYKIVENLYQIHALGNFFDYCSEPQEVAKGILKCAENRENTFAEFGKIVKKLTVV